MKGFATYGLVALGILFVAAVAGVFSSVRALAQTTIRAALVKNVDERGRVPYQAEVETCAKVGDFCTLVFPSIPAGKRLVIEHVTGLFVRVDQNAGNGVLPILLTDCHPLSGCPNPFLVANRPTFVLPIYTIESDEWGVSANLLAYVEEGAQPAVGVLISNFAQGGFFSPFVTITGYLIDKTN